LKSAEVRMLSLAHVNLVSPHEPAD
jgi:hypothetical protein